MRGEEILRELRAVGARLEVVGEQLHIDAPRGAVSASLRKAVVSHKNEVLKRIRAARSQYPPTLHATDPRPPQLVSNLELGLARARFAEHGTHPAWDDLCGAAHLERRRTWCTETLDAVYRGTMTLAFTPVGNLIAHPRGPSN